MQYRFRYLSLPSLFILLIFASGCSPKREAHAPDRLTDTIPVEILPSVFNLRISYGITDLQEFLNEKFEGEFLRTVIHPLKNDKSDVLIVLSKLRAIGISSSGQQLVCSFPLHVHADITKARINSLAKNLKPIDAEVIITLQTPVALHADWHLVTKFKITGIKWVKPAKITIAKQSIDLTKKIDEYLEKNKDQITAMLDKEVNKAVSLEKPIGKVWTDLQKPIIINKKEPITYVKFICEDIAGDFSLDTADIRCDASINTRVAILTDTTAESTVKTLPAFRENKEVSKYSDVNLYAFVDFDEITEQLTTLFKKKPLSVKGRKATIKNAEVYASRLGLTVKLETRGDIRGTLIATGTPFYDSLSQSISMHDFEFQLSSDNALLSAGDQLLHDLLRDTLRSVLDVGMGNLIGKVPEIIEKAIAKGKTGRAIDADIDEFKVHNCQILMGAQRMHIKVHASFIGAIRLKHLNPGKEIQIMPGKKKPKPA
jgi:hypothetical protein